MISAIKIGDIFTTPLSVGEDTPRIVCATNNLGINEPTGGSVAGHIASKYCQDFLELGAKDKGEIHTRNFNFGGIPAQAIAIVTNNREGGWLGKSNDNWDDAFRSVQNGFERIQEGIFSQSDPDDLQNFKDALNGHLETKDSFLLPASIKQTVDLYNSRLNPIVRSVLIGTGHSGFENDANVAGILQAMHESSANIHLYLNEEHVNMRVANIVPKFPDMFAGVIIPFPQKLAA